MILGRMNFSWVSIFMPNWRQNGAALIRQFVILATTGNDSGRRGLEGSSAKMLQVLL